MAIKKNKNVLGYIYLLIAALIWGFAFVAQKKSTDNVGAFGFNFSRYIIGAIVVSIYYFTYSKKRFVEKKRLIKNDNTIKAGILCGFALFLGATFQQIGINTTSAGNSGFITSLYIVIVPLLGIFIGVKPGLKSLFGVALAVVGFYFISINGKASFELGDLWTLVGALGFSLQIIFVDKYITSVDPVKLSIYQMIVTSFLSLIFMLIFETNTIDGFINSIWPILYVGILSSGVAFTLQIVGQQHTKITPASLIMSLESIFSLIGGIVILHEQTLASELIGSALVFISILIVIIPKKRKRLILKTKELEKIDWFTNALL